MFCSRNTDVCTQIAIMDPNKFTQKTHEAIRAASELAQDNGHAQISPVHLAIALFEDPEGLAKQAVLREGNDETLRSILRVLKKKVVRQPSVEPAPERVIILTRQDLVVSASLTIAAIFQWGDEWRPSVHDRWHTSLQKSCCLNPGN